MAYWPQRNMKVINRLLYKDIEDQFKDMESRGKKLKCDIDIN